MKMNKLNDKELLKLLKTDVQSFNDYRNHFPDQKIDFTRGNLEFIDLNGANLKGVNLQVRNSLKFANFVGANLENAEITLTSAYAISVKKNFKTYNMNAEVSIKAGSIKIGNYKTKHKTIDDYYNKWN